MPLGKPAAAPSYLFSDRDTVEGFWGDGGWLRLNPTLEPGSHYMHAGQYFGAFRGRPQHRKPRLLPDLDKKGKGVHPDSRRPLPCVGLSHTPYKKREKEVERTCSWPSPATPLETAAERYAQPRRGGEVLAGEFGSKSEGEGVGLAAGDAPYALTHLPARGGPHSACGGLL